MSTSMVQVTQRIVRKKKIVKKESFFKKILGRFLGEAKKAKSVLEGRGALQPLLALESRIGFPKMRLLIGMVSERFFTASLPPVTQKNVLEIGEGLSVFHSALLAQQPRFFCSLAAGDVGVEKARESGYPVVKGTLKNIPFETGFFDCLLARLTTPLQGDVVGTIKEIGRVLAPGGTGLILDFHPFGLYAKTGTDRLRSHQSTIRGMEDYFRMCKVAGLNVSDVHEGFLDDMVRSQFTSPDELNAFRELKGTPLVLFLAVRK